MSGMSVWFMLQPHGEILNKPIGWLTTHTTLSNNPANHRARYQRCVSTAVCRTCVTYEPSKWLTSLAISVSVSLYSTLSSSLILAVCKTCVTYEPSKWLRSRTFSVYVSLYSTLSSLLFLAVCSTCVTYEPSKWLSSLTISVCVSLYSTLSSLLILAVCKTCVIYKPSKLFCSHQCQSQQQRQNLY